MAKTLSSSSVSSAARSNAGAGRAAAERAAQGLPYFLSGLLAVVTLVASSAGFFITGLFQRDNLALGGCARGTALVILVVALPALLVCMFLSSRGSLRARLVWLGLLTYILYNSVYFTFSASFNRFFLAFLAMLSLSAWTLAALLTRLDTQEIKEAFQAKTPVRLIAIVLLVPVLLFCLTDLKESLAATFTNSLPPSILNTQLPTNHFHVVDLAFLVPAFILAAVWLWQRRAWGYTLAGMLLTYYALELLGIGSDQWFGGQADPTSPLASAAAAPFFVIGSLVAFAILIFYLRNLRGSLPRRTR